MFQKICLQIGLLCLLICLGCGSPTDNSQDDGEPSDGTETPLKDLAADHGIGIGGYCRR